MAEGDKRSYDYGPPPEAFLPPSTVVPADADPNRTTPHAGAPPPPAFDGATPAAFTIAGRYEVGAEIARGGMGAVHTAVDRAFDREVAVKLMREEYTGTDAARRFFVEARITGQLQHPGVPPIHEVGTLPDGRPYLVMKLIKGRTLTDLLAERESPAADLDRFLSIFEQICLAVAFAHAGGVIHRDLKPQNVMVGAFGEVQVMDWGLAKRLTDAEAPAAGAAVTGDAATRFGTVLGTLAYMPPEQARGDAHRVDARSDVFGLGAILCEILTGKPPHTGPKAEALWEKAATGDLSETHDRVKRSSGSQLVTRLAIRCLAADPYARPAHAGEVAATMRSIAHYLEKAARKNEVDDATAAADEKQREARRRAGAVTWIGAGGLMLGVAAAVLSFWHAAEQERTVQARVEATRDLFPLALDALARDIDSGMFKPGADRSGREDSMQRVARLIGDQDQPQQVRGYVALAAAASTARDDQKADLYWRAAVARYPSDPPEGAEVRMACAVLEWRLPDPLQGLAESQARGKLSAALDDPRLLDILHQEAAKALANAGRVAPR